MPKSGGKDKIFTYWIDVSGSCNLRCPSCPSGNFVDGDFAGARNPAGFMDVEMFTKVLAKIKADDVSSNPQVHLYNWGEPLLHPRIGDLITLVKAEGIYCGISSNLNLEKNLREAVKAGPDYLRFSLSGYEQAVYEKGHRRGDIVLVKSNLYKLRHLMDQYGSDFYVEVLHHVYRDNAVESLGRMVDLCNELGFNFSPVWAYLMPLEKNLMELEGRLPERDAAIRDRLAISPQRMFAESLPLKARNCNQQDRTMAINWNGSVQLCCNTFDHAHVIAPSFADVPHDELQKRKYAHKMCDVCMANGLHVAMSYGAGAVLDDIGNESLRDAGSPFEIRQFGQPRIARRDGGAVRVDGLDEGAHRARHGKMRPRGLRRILHRIMGR